MIDFENSDRDSSTWRKIKKHLQELLEKRRLENEQNKSVEETANLRGRIAELKALLKIADLPPDVPTRHTAE